MIMQHHHNHHNHSVIVQCLLYAAEMNCDAVAVHTWLVWPGRQGWQRWRQPKYGRQQPVLSFASSSPHELLDAGMMGMMPQQVTLVALEAVNVT